MTPPPPQKNKNKAETNNDKKSKQAIAELFKAANVYFASYAFAEQLRFMPVAYYKWMRLKSKDDGNMCLGNL